LLRPLAQWLPQPHPILKSILCLCTHLFRARLLTCLTTPLPTLLSFPRLFPLPLFLAFPVCLFVCLTVWGRGGRRISPLQLVAGLLWAQLCQLHLLLSRHQLPPYTWLSAHPSPPGHCELVAPQTGCPLERFCLGFKIGLQQPRASSAP